MGAVAMTPEPPPVPEIGPATPEHRPMGEGAPEPHRVMGGVSRVVPPPKPPKPKLMGKIAVHPERLTGDVASD